jgi:hypothetical protein
MHRIRALLQKEWRHHRVSFIFLFILMAIGFGVLVLNIRFAVRSLSILEAEGLFLLFFIPLGAMILGNRLVVKEYQGHTQLFIEALPITRVEMVMVKYALGFAFLAGIVLLTLSLSSWMVLDSEPVSRRFLCILTLRSVLFVYFVWSFLFAMGFTGRFRIPIYCSIGIGLMIISGISEFDITRVGPLALVNLETFPFERYEIPVRELMQTLVLGSAWIILGIVLSLIHEGSVAESLARPMTQREKATVGILFITFLVAAALLESKKEKEPYQFTGDAIISSEIEPIEIMYIHDGLKSDAETLTKLLETKLTGLRETLGMDELPPIRVAYRHSLDRKIFETASLEDTDGVLVRANFRDVDTWHINDFVAYIIRAVLDQTTRNRSRFEPKRWLHDGFSLWWAMDGFNRDPDAHNVMLLRSLTALREQELSVDILKKWLLFRERHGEGLSEAVAYTGLAYLQELKGPEAVVRLACAVFGRRPPNDIREIFYELFHPMPQIFEEATGVPWDKFISGWDAWLLEKAGTPEIRTKLDAIPTVRGHVRVEAKGGNILDIVYGYEFINAPDKRPVCALLHKKLTPFDEELAMTEILRDEFQYDPASKDRDRHLMGRYGSGERIFVALEYDSHILGVPVRILAKRMNLP